MAKHWIKVEDQAPPLNEFKLFVLKNGIYRVGKRYQFTYRDGSQTYRYHDGRCTIKRDRIIAWTDIPEYEVDDVESN